MMIERMRTVSAEVATELLLCCISSQGVGIRRVKMVIAQVGFLRMVIVALNTSIIDTSEPVAT